MKYISCIHHLLVAAAITLATQLPYNTLAEDYLWPEFRGPGKQGHASARNVPTEWSNTKNLDWKIKTGLGGWASPVVSHENIILAGSKEEGDQLTLHIASFKLSDGSLNWEKQVFAPSADIVKQRHSKNSHASCTPILADGKIYAHFGHFGTCALDLETGNILWKKVIEYKPVHGNGGSPALVEGLLVFSVDGNSDPAVYALNADTGDIAWKTPRHSSASRKFSFSTPLIVEVNGQKQIISPGSGMVGAYAVKDGNLIWQVQYGEGYSVIPRPILHNQKLFIGTGYNKPNLLAIRLTEQTGDLTDTHIAWETDKSAPHTPSMIAVNGGLYFISDNGILTCADPDTGDVHWSERVRGNYSASPVAVDNHIYFISESGKVTIIEANTQAYTVVAENDLEERTLASPAVWDDTLLIRTQEYLWKITKH
ncbi:MAG: PQQ-binding-like beta-propeller repeat protein [Verrucomicrobiota bacterium]|jgi:outer membrane protein assembly factor BamB